MAENELTLEQLTEMARTVLEKDFWIPAVRTDEVYARGHDDDDGDRTQQLVIQVGPDGDIWISVQGNRHQTLRYRHFFGGGLSPRVRNALMLLAYAIKLDNDAKPFPSE